MKNILFVYSSLKESGSETNYVISQLEDYVVRLGDEKRPGGIQVEYINLGTLYHEDPDDISDRVRKAFRALDKKRKPVEEIYREKLLVLQRYTRRLTRDLLRAQKALEPKKDVIKVFSRNLRNHPVVPYNENIHKMVTAANPAAILRNYEESINSVSIGGGTKVRVSYAELEHAMIAEIYTEALNKHFQLFENFLQLYIANKYMNEYLNADAVIIGAPIYNHNIPSRLQNYLNYWVRAGITFDVHGKAEHPHMLYNKDFTVVVACAEESDEYGKYVQHFFRKFTRHIGVHDLNVKMLDRRVESNRMAREEADALVTELKDRLRLGVQQARYLPYNVQRLRSIPHIEDYPRIEPFTIAFEQSLPYGHNINPQLARQPFNLADYQAHYVDPESIGKRTKKELTTLSFTNFMFAK